MDASHRARRRRAGGPRLPNLALIAGLFISPAVAAAVGQLEETSPLAKRRENEHVVLADCRDRNDVVSSQMAYYLSDPNSAPQDVTVVATTPGQAALWVNANTTGLFTDTGVSFTSILGPRVENGQFAGTGYNDYGNFSCYQLYYKDLYTYGTTTCSQVYLCDHSDPPASTAASSSGSSMSQGTIIGIAVGVVGGLLFALAAGLVFWYLRRSRRAPATSQGTRSSRLSSELLRSGTMSQGPGSDMGEPKSPVTVAQLPSQPVMQQMSAVYEMDGRLFRIEMASDNGKFEMDALGHGSAELETAKGEATAATTTETKAVSPISPAVTDSPLEHDPPKSPPPEYVR